MKPVVGVVEPMLATAFQPAQTAQGGVFEKARMERGDSSAMAGEPGTATASGPWGSTAGRAMAINMTISVQEGGGRFCAAFTVD